MLDPFSVLAEEHEELPDDFDESIQSLSASTFWSFIAALLLSQAGLLATSLGLMLVGFRGQWAIGGTLTLGGLLALGLAVLVYRWQRSQA